MAEPAGPKERALEVEEIEDDPGLPRVLLIGDSISSGYKLPTRERLHGRANLHRIPENAATTARGLERLEGYLGDAAWDVIHFNWGLHDMKVMEDGVHQVPIEDYEKNLRELVARLKATGARLIWAATTPAPEGAQLADHPKRFPEDAPRYNEIARRIMEENGIPINDLFAVSMEKCEHLRTKPDNVHYTQEGYNILADSVAASILDALN